MGGEIGVESRPGEGSRFWFSISATVAILSDTGAADAAIDRLAFEGVRVLVADDHATNRELVRLFLAGVGADITEAADGEEAARLAAEWPFDVIMLDLRMPVLDGLGALQRIRGSEGPNDATPILAFTADADALTPGRLEAMGFQDVVSKPLEPGALIQAIARATAWTPDIQPRELSDVA